MLMCPVDRLASFSSGSAMMAEQSAIWAVNIEKCTENDRWLPVIYSSAIVLKISSSGYKYNIISRTKNYISSKISGRF